MTYRNYLIKNNPTSSYLLRIKIPKDLRYYFDGKIGFTMSLKNGIHSQSIGFAKILRLEVQSIFNSIRVGTMSKINVNQIKDILRNKIERTLTHSQWVVTDTNTFVESEVKDKIEEINGEERILKTQIEQNYDGVLEHIEKEIARIIKSRNLTLDSKSLEFNQLRKQFLELRLIRNTWKKELLEDSGKSIEDFREEIYKKFNIKDEPTDLDLLLKLQTSESILGSRILRSGLDKKNVFARNTHLQPVIENYVPEPIEPYKVAKRHSPFFCDMFPKHIERMRENKRRDRTINETIETYKDVIELLGNKPVGEYTKIDGRDCRNS